jgi:hypothetical protein
VEYRPDEPPDGGPHEGHGDLRPPHAAPGPAAVSS